MVWFDPLDWDEFEFFFRPWRMSRKMLPESKELMKLGEYRPAVSDLMETETSIIANIELPGINKDDIELNVTPTHIEVRAEAKEEKEVKEKGVYRYAKRASSFYRSLPLPKEVDAEKAKASFNNGVLRVEIPKLKKEERKGKRVKIE